MRPLHDPVECPFPWSPLKGPSCHDSLPNYTFSVLFGCWGITVWHELDQPRQQDLVHTDPDGHGSSRLQYSDPHGRCARVIHRSLDTGTHSCQFPTHSCIDPDCTDVTCTDVTCTDVTCIDEYTDECTHHQRRRISAHPSRNHGCHFRCGMSLCCMLCKNTGVRKTLRWDDHGP
jgi:hypothetical protein